MAKLGFKVKWGRLLNKMAAALYFGRKRHRLLSTRVAVPNLVGLSKDNAILTIRNANLTLGSVILTNDPVASQYPVADTEVAPYSSVTITLTS